MSLNNINSSIKHTFNLADSRVLTQHAYANFGLDVLTILMSAFNRSFNLWSDRNVAAFIVINSGRTILTDLHGLDTSKLVGWIGMSPIVFINKPDESNPLRYLEAIQKQYKAVPNEGVSHDLLYWLKDRSSDYDGLPAVPDDDKLLINFHGELKNSGKTNSIGITQSSIPVGNSQNFKNRKLWAFRCDAYILNEQLTVIFDYEYRNYTRDTAQKLFTKLLSYLNEFTSCIKESIRNENETSYREKEL